MVRTRFGRTASPDGSEPLTLDVIMAVQQIAVGVMHSTIVYGRVIVNSFRGPFPQSDRHGQP